MEEVERFSKPGSVAEKKAYFEAQHKRKAALKAAKLVEEANAFANDDVPELKTTSDFHNDSPMDTESANESSHMVIDEQKQEYMHTSDNDIPNKMELANTSSHAVIDEKDIPDTEVAHSANVAEDSGTADMEYAVGVENLNHAAHSKQLQRADVHDKIADTTDEKTPNKVKCEAMPYLNIYCLLVYFYYVSD